MEPSEGRAKNVKFKASRVWLEKFMHRINLSLRRKTAVAQKDPYKLIANLVTYIIQVRRVQEKKSMNLLRL